ncbi:CYTH domain-containing protein [Candidatus Omnitrophota bacterium]
MPIESEIKFTIPDKTLLDAIAKLDEIADFTSVDCGTLRHHDIYFDTEDSLLYRKKIVLRLRTSQRGSLLTFKAQGASRSGIYKRVEIETPTDATAEDITQGKLPNIAPIKALYEKTGKIHLINSLYITNDRHTFFLEISGRKCYELVLDDVTFSGPRGEKSIYELEVESMGEKCDNDLMKIGNWLTNRFGLKMAGPSKYMLGMELVGNLVQ